MSSTADDDRRKSLEVIESMNREQDRRDGFLIRICLGLWTAAVFAVGVIFGLSL